MTWTSTSHHANRLTPLVDLDFFYDRRLLRSLRRRRLIRLLNPRHPMPEDEANSQMFGRAFLGNTRSPARCPGNGPQAREARWGL
jgi:hypothetical protein